MICIFVSRICFYSVIRTLRAFGSVWSVVLKHMMGTKTFEIIIQITAVSLLFVFVIIIIIIFNVEMYQTESFRE